MLYVLSSYKLYYRGILIFSNLLHLLQLFGPKMVKHHNWTCEFFLPPNNFCFRRNEDSWNRLGFHYILMKYVTFHFKLNKPCRALSAPYKIW